MCTAQEKLRLLLDISTGFPMSRMMLALGTAEAFVLLVKS